jgi:hypothetical protein
MLISNGLHSTKKGAAKEAAKHMLDRIQAPSELPDQHQLQELTATHLKRPKIVTGGTGDTIGTAVFIDLENATRDSNLFQELSDKMNARVFGFLSRYHHNYNKSFGIEVFTIDSNRRDACDVGMIMYITRYILDNDDINNIVFVTRDKFGSALVDCINTNFINIGRHIEAKLCVDYSHVIESLNANK